MNTEIDNDTDREDNVVPEPTAASSFGNPSLDADRIDDDTDAKIDALLDEAIAKHSEENEDQKESTGDANPVVPDTEPDLTPREPVQQIPQAVVQPQQSDIDPEIAAIEQPRNLSEKNQNNWRKLQETASTYKRQAEEASVLKQRLQEMESQAPQVQTPSDYDELKKFRQIFDIKNDPEFRSKYEQPLSQAKDTIYNILKKHGASEEVIQSIEKAGGPEKIDQTWWKNNAIDKLPLTDSERLKRSLVDVVDLQEKQQQELEYVAQHAEEIMHEKQMQSYYWYENENQEVEKQINSLTENLPWARYQEVPQGASQEDIDRISQHNSSVDALAQKFNAALWPQTSQDRTNIAAAAVFSHVLTEELQRTQQAYSKVQNELKLLQSENNKLKGAGKMPRQTVNTGSSSKPSSLNDRLKMSSIDAIEMGLSEAGL